MLISSGLLIFQFSVLAKSGNMRIFWHNSWILENRTNVLKTENDGTSKRSNYKTKTATGI